MPETGRKEQPAEGVEQGQLVGVGSAPGSRPASAQSRRKENEYDGANDKSRRTSNSSAKAPLKSPGELFGSASPESTDRVYQYPIRTAMSIDHNRSVDPGQTPLVRSERGDSYFPPQRYGSDRRGSASSSNTNRSKSSRKGSADIPAGSASESDDRPAASRKKSIRSNAPRLPPHVFDEIVSSRNIELDTGGGSVHSSGDAHPPSGRSATGGSSFRSRNSMEDLGGFATAKFKHIIQEGGHFVITGRDGDTLQRCEDEPIHCPGAVQGYGLLIALQEEEDGKLVVRIVSENSTRMIGYTPKQLFGLDNFCDILSEEQADNLLDHIDFVRDEDADLEANGPEVFTMTIRTPQRRSRKLWCALHVCEDLNRGLIVCEFELEDDPVYPLVPPNEHTPELPEDTLGNNPTEAEFLESTENISRPLRVLRSARKRKGETAAMEVFNIMSQVQEQLAVAPNLEKFLKVLVGVMKELTGFHRIMIYQFDSMWNGRVVTELVDPRATKDLYKGLNFPASDIPSQARQLYKTNKVRLLYDRDADTARLVCRTMEDLEKPLDMTHCYLRAMSPIHLKYLANMAVRSSMSVSINAFNELWGLIACHTYGPRGMRVSFPIRKMCRLVGDSASRNIERLSYASRLQARKLISTRPTEANPSGYIVASSEDLLKLFDADFGVLCIRDETKILGDLEQSQEALVLIEYLRMRKLQTVLASEDITQDFPDLRYPPGFSVTAGLLVVPLSGGGHDFIVFFRKGQLKEVKWAGNPYEKFVREGTEGYLEPRKSFRVWREVVVSRCREWTEEEIETAAVLCLVYGKFIEVWRQKEAALQSSQLTRLLLANSAHEVRTPLNAIINYLEIALEGSLDQETRENLAKSHSASKSLIYVINDLLDLTKTEEGIELIKGESFDLKATLKEATDLFVGDAKRKNISYEVTEAEGLPHLVVGDQRRVRQAISNITANAIQNTTEGGVKVEMYIASWEDRRCNVEIAITDTGAGMSTKKLDSLFRELEQVQTETGDLFEQQLMGLPSTTPEANRTLGLGLAVVARIIRNMQGQLRLKSEEGQGSRFVVQFPFDLPDSEPKHNPDEVKDVSQTDDKEKTLIYPAHGPSRRPSSEALVRKNSRDSITGSIKSQTASLRSQHSANSARSVKNDVDRLIEDINKPPSASRPQSGGEGAKRRPSFGRRRTSQSGPLSPYKKRSKSLEGGSSTQMSATYPPPHLRGPGEPTTPGQENVMDSRTPIKAVKMPDETGSPAPENASMKSGIIGEVYDDSERKRIEDAPLNGDCMRVLVAEDDPVNSKIIQKRLEKLGHDVKLTVNGEECSSVYGTDYTPDCILMDIQMPIVDGITSTKMIRSFEKSHPTHELSQRARLNGRVPIIAVSASLVEKDRQSYIDHGFDGWILKPISFPRLSELMTGIVDPKVREAALYKPGQWEKGGWFQKAQPDIFSADTKPSEDVPTGNMSKETKIGALVDEDPFDNSRDHDRVTEEQRRLRQNQEKENEKEEQKTEEESDLPEGKHQKSHSAPELARTVSQDELQDLQPPKEEAPSKESPEAT